MCWMTVRADADPLPRAVADAREHEPANGHSWGWALARDGELVTDRGVGRFPDDELPVGEAALAHTRAATVGEITEANAHPFEVRRGGEPVAALAHNGTWYEAPDLPGWSDSRAMAAVLEGALAERPDADFADALRALGELTGETLAALHRSGEAYVYSGRYDITAGGAAAASSGLARDLEEGLHGVANPSTERPSRGRP